MIEITSHDFAGFDKMNPVYVINLNRSPDRLASITAQLHKSSISFERVDAIDGKECSEGERKKWVGLRPRDGVTEWLDGQIGCFKSHLKAWLCFLKTDAEWALILEDDVHLSSSLGRVWSDKSWLPDDADLIKFDTTRQGVKLGSPTHAPMHQISVAMLESKAWTTGGYAIRRDVAEWLLHSPPRMQLPIDYFLFDKSNSRIARSLRVYQLRPALVIQDKYNLNQQTRKGFNSLIESNINAPVPEYHVRIAKQIGRFLCGRKTVHFRS